MNISFFLKPKCDLSYIYADNTLRRAIEKIKECGYTSIPVIDRLGKYLGSLSEGDLLRAVLDGTNEKTLVEKILRSRQNSPVNIDEPIENLLLLSADQNFVPVLDDREIFIGIVTRKDILQYFFKLINFDSFPRESVQID